jgi:nucleoside-diphosphate-sugar epimerase
MSLHLHLLGGSGRIGSALIESLLDQPIHEIAGVYVYCDSTKIPELTREFSLNSVTPIQAREYSTFRHDQLLQDDAAIHDVRHVAINLRGVNNKQTWLNQPLEAMDLQIRSCCCLIDSDLWMFPYTEIIHLSSQLCDLIEGSNSLEEICQGQESYRRPYMVSRLHQEAMLAANAYKHSILTSFVRLPAVYGFSDDYKSPWVLNSLCNQSKLGQHVVPRNPNSQIYLTHRLALIAFLRSLISTALRQKHNRRTVRFLKPPMLQMSVQKLADLVKHHSSSAEEQWTQDDSVCFLRGVEEFPGFDQSQHCNLLSNSIKGLLHNV